MIETSFELVAEMGRRLKLEQVLKHGNDADPEAADLRTFVSVVRNGRHVALVHTAPGFDSARQCTYWAAALMRPHEIYLVADSRGRSAPAKEDLELRKGQLQEEWLAGKRDGIFEAMCIYRLPFLGPATCAMYPYERQGRQLHWLEAMHNPDHIEGAIPDYARDGYRVARDHLAEMEQTLHGFADLVGLPAAEREEHTERALARYVSQRDGVGAVDLLEVGRFYVNGEEMEEP